MSVFIWSRVTTKSWAKASRHHSGVTWMWVLDAVLAGQTSLADVVADLIRRIAEPELVILDEPINGFDPQGITSVRELITAKQKEGVTFIISSHILGELSKIATKYGFINNGKIIEESTTKELLDKCKSKIELIPSDV